MLTTPSLQSLEPGTYEIEVPLLVNVSNVQYRFCCWDDGSTRNIRRIELTGDLVVTATFMVTPLTVKSVRGNRHILSYKTVIQTENYVRHVLKPF